MDRAGVVAQELVDRRQLAADARRLAAGLLGAPFGLTDRAASGLGAAVAVAPLLERRSDGPL